MHKKVGHFCACPRTGKESRVRPSCEKIRRGACRFSPKSDAVSKTRPREKTSNLEFEAVISQSSAKIACVGSSTSDSSEGDGGEIFGTGVWRADKFTGFRADERGLPKLMGRRRPIHFRGPCQGGAIQLGGVGCLAYLLSSARRKGQLNKPFTYYLFNTG